MRDASDKKTRRPFADGFNTYTKASFYLAIAPIVVLLWGFIFCLVFSGGMTSDNGRGAIWWVMIALITVLVPVTPVTSAVSLVTGVIGIKKHALKKTLFLYSGIIIASLEVLALLVLLFNMLT